MKYLVALLLASCTLLPAQWKSIGNLDSAAAQGNSILLYSGVSRVLVEVLKEDVVRIRLAPTGEFLAHNSLAVVRRLSPVGPPNLKHSSDFIEISAGKGTVRVRKHPLRLQFLDNNGTVLDEDDPAKGMAWDGSDVRDSARFRRKGISGLVV